MSIGSGNKYEMRRRALLEAIRFCGGVTAYSKCLKISDTRAGNWVNRPEIEVPYEYAVLTEDITQVSIERLSPFTEAANKVIRRLRAKETPPPINVELSEIYIGEQPYQKSQDPNRPIIVGTDGVLISGLMQIEMYRAARAKKVGVMRLDLEVLLIEKRSIQEMKVDLLISERVAIGIRLEQLLGNHQGQRNDIKHRKNSIDASGIQPCRKCDEVKGGKGGNIAHVVGLPSRDAYYRAKLVYLSGNSELINLLDQKRISISMAAKKVISIKDFQRNSKQSNLQGAPL